MPYTLTYRSVKGSPLTSAEGDGNVHNLDDRVTDLETNPPEAVSIADVTASGDQLTFLMTDSTTRGPVTIDVSSFNPRGTWATNTLYSELDFFFAPDGQSYVVRFNHTSDPSTFDPGANDGLGHDYYELFFAIPAMAIPVGGGPGDVLAKNSATDFDLIWLPSQVQPIGTIADITFAPSLGDANTYWRCTHSLGCTITIPFDVNVGFAIGTELHFRQCQVSALIISGDSDSTGDVIINSISGFETATDTQGAVVTLKKIGADEWDIWGLLAASGSV